MLNKHAPLKSKVIRGNNKPFVTRTLRKAILRSSALKKKANNLNDPLAINSIKNKEITLSIVAEKLRNTILRNMCHMA